MHSLEIIKAINSPDHVDIDPGESKARFWIRKGVERALEKARFQAQETLDLGTEEGHLSDSAKLDLEVDLRVLSAPETVDALVASAWHRRAGGPSS